MRGWLAMRKYKRLQYRRERSAIKLQAGTFNLDGRCDVGIILPPNRLWVHNEFLYLNLISSSVFRGYRVKRFFQKELEMRRRARIGNDKSNFRSYKRCDGL